MLLPREQRPPDGTGRAERHFQRFLSAFDRGAVRTQQCPQIGRCGAVELPRFGGQI
jgi:hypothetical protein